MKTNTPVIEKSIFNFIRESLAMEYYKYDMIQVEEVSKDSTGDLRETHLGTFISEETSEDKHVFTHYGKNMNIVGELNMYCMLTMLNTLIEGKKVFRLKTESNFYEDLPPQKYLTIVVKR